MTENIYLAGSGKHGFQISHALDCNVYVLDCGGQYAMIDAGSGIDPERIVGNARRDGVDFARVTHLLLTHAHGDHAAGAFYFQHRYGIRVVAAKEAAPWLESADMEKTSLEKARSLGAYPENYALRPITVTQAVDDGDTVAIGTQRLTVISTPGHARGHVCYVWRTGPHTALFSGDAIFAGGCIYIQPTWDCSLPEYAHSIDRLHRLNIDGLFAGHGACLLHDAHQHVAHAHDCFSRLEIPLNL